jgi:hypothetical protein
MDGTMWSQSGNEEEEEEEEEKLKAESGKWK